MEMNFFVINFRYFHHLSFASPNIKMLLFLRASRARGAWSNLIILVNVVWGEKITNWSHQNYIVLYQFTIFIWFDVEIDWRFLEVETFLGSWLSLMLKKSIKMVNWMIFLMIVAFYVLRLLKRNDNNCLIIISRNFWLIEASMGFDTKFVGF